MTQKEFDLQMSMMNIANLQKTDPMQKEINDLKEQRVTLELQRICITEKISKIDVEIRKINMNIENENREYRRLRNQFIIDYIGEEEEDIDN